MNDKTTVTRMTPIAADFDNAYRWVMRQLMMGNSPQRYQELLAEALYTVCATTGEAGLGALLLFAATVDEVGAGEGGR